MTISASIRAVVSGHEPDDMLTQVPPVARALPRRGRRCREAALTTRSLVLYQDGDGTSSGPSPDRREFCLLERFATRASSSRPRGSASAGPSLGVADGTRGRTRNRALVTRS